MSKKSISLSQACEGMIRYRQATGKSENTIADYRVTFKKLFYYFESDPQIGVITRGEMVEFFAWLQEYYLTVPDGVAPQGNFKRNQGAYLVQLFEAKKQHVVITTRFCATGVTPLKP